MDDGSKSSDHTAKLKKRAKDKKMEKAEKASKKKQKVSSDNSDWFNPVSAYEVSKPVFFINQRCA